MYMMYYVYLKSNIRISSTVKATYYHHLTMQLNISNPVAYAAPEEHHKVQSVAFCIQSPPALLCKSFCHLA